ncbi:MAG TPA: DNA recombination/repair protein RecA, partial [Candidatus Omnitrophota bacterium]|nr:DNA recombination/repair protein RecA [Candidatus Omnitrophota bacterium]
AVVGGHVRVRVVKNKVAPPFREAEFDILHDQGINKAGSIIDAGVNLEVIQKSGTWMSYNNEKIGQGREAAINALRENQKLSDDIEKEIRKKIVAGM